MTELPTEHEQVEAERDSITKFSRLHWFHWAVVVLSLVLTISAWQFSRHQLQGKTQARFDRAATHILEQITERMRKYEEGLWGGVSAIHSHGGEISHSDWIEFASALKIDLRYPGINGIGVIHHVNREDLPAYLQDQRLSRPDFDIYPPHANADLLPITYIEPVAINAKAVGLDIAHEQNRYAAALKARDTGLAQITGPIVLVQDQSRTPGFLFYTPFYMGLSHETVEKRREDFIGLVYAPFVFRKLIEGALEADRRSVRISIRDNDDVLYDEGSGEATGIRDEDRAYSQVRNVMMYGRTWVFDIWSTPDFLEENASSQPALILAGGFMIDGLLLLLFVTLTRANRRALAFVNSATGQLQHRTAELETSNQELESFAYAASHDLKAPLRGISNLANWIREDLEDLGDALPGDVAEHMTLLQGRVRRMETLLQDLLQYSRAGREKSGPEEVDLGPEVRETFDLISPSKDFTLDLQDSLPRMVTARAPLLQVFQNLIENAIKHHDREHGEIRIRSEDLGSMYRFSVSDDGCGIAPEFHEKIFGIFQTLKGRDEVEASGMGLSIVKRIVLSVGGEISVESDPGKGRGSTFHFSWPKEWRGNR